jgi:hypothetical protein
MRLLRNCGVSHVSGAAAVTSKNLTVLDDDRDLTLSPGKLEHPGHRLAIFQHIVVHNRFTAPTIVLTGL